MAAVDLDHLGATELLSQVNDMVRPVASKSAMVPVLQLEAS